MNEKIEINIGEIPEETDIQDFDENDFALNVEMYGEDASEEKTFIAGKQPFISIEPMTFQEDGVNGYRIISSLFTDDPKNIGEFLHELSTYDWGDMDAEGEETSEEIFDNDSEELNEEEIGEMFAEEVGKFTERLDIEEIREHTGIDADDHALYHLAELLVSKGIMALEVEDDEIDNEQDDSEDSNDQDNKND